MTKLTFLRASIESMRDLTDNLQSECAATIDSDQKLRLKNLVTKFRNAIEYNQLNILLAEEGFDKAFQRCNCECGHI